MKTERNNEDSKTKAHANGGNHAAEWISVCEARINELNAGNEDSEYGKAVQSSKVGLLITIDFLKFGPDARKRI